MTGSTREGDVPDDVVALLHAAVAGSLLSDADGMATSLTAAGWVRGAPGGTWACAADPAWTVESVDRPPSVAVFTYGWDDAVARAGQRLRARLDAGEAGLRPDPGAADPGAADLDAGSWSAGGALVLLRVERQHWSGSRLVPATLQLALEHAAAVPDDPSAVSSAAAGAEEARRVARAGSAVARWYLAADATLPDDVVELLAHDDDPRVVVALAEGAAQRRLARGDA